MLTFGKQVRKGSEQIFCFNLECTTDDLFESEGLKNNILRIAIHDEPPGGMLAFSSVSTNDLSIYSEHEIKESEDWNSFFNTLELHFSSNNPSTYVKDDAKSLSIMCSIFQKKKTEYVDKEVETACYGELEKLIISNHIKDVHGRSISVGVDTEEKPIYTAEHLEELHSELEAFKEAYDNSVACTIRMDASTSPLVDYSNDNEVDLQYDPVHQYPRFSSCPVRRVTFNDKNLDDKFLKRELTVPNMNSRSKRICEKLPKDFLTRLQLFQAEKGKHRDQLRKDVREKKSEEICKRLEAERKLSSDDITSLHDACLPSVFMPTKNNVVYKVKARSYLHPSNQVLLKPMLQLPNVQDMTSSKNLQTLRLEATETK